MGPQDVAVILVRLESVGQVLCRPIRPIGRRRARDDDKDRQPILADEIQTFKALITAHKVLQEGHPIAVKEAQQNVQWVESLARGVNGEGLRGYGPLIREYVFFLLAKLAFHRQHPEFNGEFKS